MSGVLAASVSLSDQRSLFEGFPALLCTARFDGSFVEVNEALQAALGFASGEMPATSFAGLAHPGDREAVSVPAEGLSKASGGLDSDADEFIAHGVDGAARMKVLIDDLLAYSRAGAGALVRRRVDCNKLVRSALADLDRVMVESGAEVVVEELPVVEGDPGQLALLFQNLLSNALEFVADEVPPSIRVSAERMGAAWCFTVEDNGIGIDELHRERIFLMFKRLPGRSEYPGTGIGLALCHKIVDRLGGRIWVGTAQAGRRERVSVHAARRGDWEGAGVR